MIYNTKKIQEEAKKDFFGTWKKAGKWIPKPNKAFITKLLKPTKPEPHPIQNTVHKIRSIFLRLGFREVENTLFIDEQEVYRQYGPEAPAILDRCYYLAGIPRPDIGLSEAKILEIRKVAPNFNNTHARKLKEVLRDYKLGRIEGDDLVETIRQRLDIETEQATKILSLFDELKNLRAEPTTTTLRSHMTAAWFPTLRALQDRLEFPIKLFSIGLRFRREQRVDATHLRAHYGASCVVCDPEMELEAGKAITASILGPLGFKDLEYEQKQTTSTYYTNGSELEVFARSNSGRIEVADIGMYSPIALANYDIKYPTFNAGFGIERIIMIKENITDVREVMFPQFYQAMELSDEDILRAIHVDRAPTTTKGRELSEAIQKTAAENADAPSPCSFEVFSGKIAGRNMTVAILENEANTRLLGPAAMNEIYVYKGGIYGIPKEGFNENEKVKEIRKNGINTGISYLRAISDYFAAGIEEAAKAGRSYSHQFKIAKTAPDLNIKIDDHVMRYLQSKKKELMLKGPIFTTVEAKLN